MMKLQRSCRLRGLWMVELDGNGSRRCGDRLECHCRAGVGDGGPSSSRPGRVPGLGHRPGRRPRRRPSHRPTVQTISRTNIPGASGSPAAAAARAAHDVLVNILPGQAASLDTTYHDYLAAHGLAEDDPGVSAGEAGCRWHPRPAGQ